MNAPVLVVHGGAGAMTGLTPEREQRCRAALHRALLIGHEVMTDGGTAQAAVVAAVKVLEDAPEFNAGRGSVYASDGQQYMDASLMRGDDRNAGAVCGLQGIRNPIDAARVVMEKSPHAMMAGPEAGRFVHAQGLPRVRQDWFYDEYRYLQWRRAKARGGPSLDHSGTVGAVALDRKGLLAAATSTGGMVGKHPARVGDTAVIGAGTWADNNTCAVSATGHGELFIRNNVAARVASLMEMAGAGLMESARHVVLGELPDQGAEGGLIAVDRQGRVAMPFNSAGMFRGLAGPDGHRRVWVGPESG